MPARQPNAGRTHDTVVERFAPLEDDDVAAHTDSGSFSRGRSYFRRGAITDPTLVGGTLSAGCWGSEPDPYRVTATLAPAGEDAADNPRAWSCTCPRGGFCKHVVALLLTWIDDPSKFEERPPIAVRLAGRSREELLALVERMTLLAPELERLVDLPLPAAPGAVPAAAPNEATVDPATLRRQVTAAFRGARIDEWRAAERIAGDLEPVLTLGDGYADAGQWANAALVYAELAIALLARYWEVRDEAGDLGALLASCDNGLARCLDAQADLAPSARLPTELRERAIQAIYDIWRLDVVEAGGTGISEGGPEAVGRAATAVERARLDALLAEVPNAVVDEWSKGWVRSAAVGFRAMLAEGGGGGDAAVLQLYRDAELWHETASLLLAMGQVKEAVALAGRKLLTATDLLPFADELVERGGEHVGAALALVDERLWESEGRDARQDANLRQWLATQYTRHDRPREALAMARRLFTVQPTLPAYHKVKEAATLPSQPAETWPAVHRELVAELSKQKAWSLLTEVHLAENDAPAAIAALAKAERGGMGQGAFWLGGFGQEGALDLRVAEAAEKDAPDEAIRIYRRAAERLIEGRQRASYRAAAEYLSRVKRLLESNGRGDEWRRLIADLRETRKSLRALRDELDARDLR